MVVKSSHIFFVYIGIPTDGYHPAGGETKYAGGCISDKGKNGVIDI